MTSIPEKLIKLGFDTWFQNHVDPGKETDLEVARVVAVHKDSYAITKGDHDLHAELLGKLLFNAASPLDYPAAGDWVFVKCFDDDSFSIIHDILPRKTLLKRKTPGKKVSLQLIAANIDTAFIVQSLDDNFNLRRLERYLVMINESKIQPVVLLSKSDLLPVKAIEGRIEQIHTIMPRLHVQPFSNKNQSGLQKIKDLLDSGTTYCLLGSSGVGKTTLLNNLIGRPEFKTKAIREKDGKGRHATTSRQLIALESGAMVVDTPGMRELGNFFVDTGIDETFSEIGALAEYCRFGDCTHTQEKGCAVLSAVADGLLSEERYRNYIKMNRETAFNEMSYIEKRHKDKQFGKMVKSIMKNKKNKR